MNPLFLTLPKFASEPLQSISMTLALPFQRSLVQILSIRFSLSIEYKRICFPAIGSPSEF
jgi:hypothetical protein